MLGIKSQLWIFALSENYLFWGKKKQDTAGASLSEKRCHLRLHLSAPCPYQQGQMVQQRSNLGLQQDPDCNWNQPGPPRSAGDSCDGTIRAQNNTKKIEHLNKIEK